MPFLPPNQQRQSTEGNSLTLVPNKKDTLEWMRVNRLTSSRQASVNSRLPQQKQVATVLLAWSHITIAPGQPKLSMLTAYSPAQVSPPPKGPPSCGQDSGPHLIHDSLGPAELAPKWHLDRFSHFCRAYCCVQQTGKPQNIGNDRINLAPRATIKPNNIWKTLKHSNTHVCLQLFQYYAPQNNTTQIRQLLSPLITHIWWKEFAVKF